MGYVSLLTLRTALTRIALDDHMKRREFISLIGGAAAWPLTARAQEPGRVRRVGVLLALADSDPEGKARIAAFQRELQNLGWTEGRNVLIEYRWASGDTDRLRAFAAELASMRPDVLVGNGSISAEPLGRVTSTIPIVFAMVSDPVASGLAASLSEPGGNATGFTNFEPSMGAKWIEFLGEFSPRLARVAILFNPDTAPRRGSIFLRSAETAARTLAIEPIRATVSNADQIEHAVATLSHRADSGLIVMPDVFTTIHRDLIIALAARHRVPAVYPYRFFAESGGLISYGTDVPAVFRRAAGYVDKVLRGAAPGNLPVQHPDKFELVINMRTANALRLEVPRVLLARADEVIE
jgi:putative tryptophan/tyrosine transport system substrate-binding protein